MNYEQEIQNTSKEVVDALVLRQSIANQIGGQQRYLDSLRITLQCARVPYQNGVVSCIEVLDTGRFLFVTRQSLLDLNYAQQVNKIKLFAALSGGWAE